MNTTIEERTKELISKQAELERAIPSFPTFPPRPCNGGPLEKAVAKDGGWFYEPKYNGWRTLIHVPTKRMFNRKGDPLSIAHEFPEALEALSQAVSGGNLQRDGDPVEWYDCEALSRRHSMGKGSLIVLDGVMEGTYGERRARLRPVFPVLGMPPWCLNLGAAGLANLKEIPEDNGLYLTPRIVGSKNALVAWRAMQGKGYGDFFEGLVAKHEQSRYPIQLQSPSTEYNFWIKHRWAY